MEVIGIEVLLIILVGAVPLYLEALLFLPGLEGTDLKGLDVGGEGGDDPGIDVMLEAESFGQSGGVVPLPNE